MWTLPLICKFRFHREGLRVLGQLLNDQSVGCVTEAGTSEEAYGRVTQYSLKFASGL